ncbi:hypothetical protein CL689_04675 [Candidatus Saccharibacteria bacterium]|nr:hypothetical protein [Candidatus Saccharibacteria bacterium]|tara:strand:+ start:3287 stop:4345 length:1059 start_codon:yes stop_codon:yes gene_type:complete
MDGNSIILASFSTGDLAVNLITRIFGGPQKWRDRGDAARDRKNWKEAIEAYTQYLKLSPLDGPILVQLGHALKEAGQNGRAGDAYQKALSVMPEDADLHLQIGHLEKKMGRYRRARQFYAKAHELAPHLSDATAELEKLPVMTSSEFQSATESGCSQLGSIPIADIVQGVYLALLGREPEADGHRLYGEALKNGMRVEALITEFLTLRRGLPVPSGGAAYSEIVGDSYRAIFGRDAEAEGVELYGNALSQGMKIEAFLTELLSSTEFKESPRNSLLSELIPLRGACEKLLDVLSMTESLLELFLLRNGYKLQIPEAEADGASPETLFSQIRTILQTIVLVQLQDVGRERRGS